MDAHIQAIHKAGAQFVLLITGGGSAAIGRLLAVPGGSRSILECAVPYSSAALDDWLGAAPEQYCSPRTARSMAAAALARARQLVPDAARPVGIGCTASLASDRPKRGEHRIIVAAQTLETTDCWSLALDKTQTRAAEEQTAADLILQAMASAANVAAGSVSQGATPTNAEPQRLHEQTIAPANWSALLRGSIAKTLAHPSLAADDDSAAPRCIFPGAFNPRHLGHRRMADIAAHINGEPVEHELSLLNVDKPPLDFTEIAARAAHFMPGEPLWLTRAATFREKADLFPAATFVVGADTIARIADAKYYGNDPARRDAAIAHLARQRCRFLVFGRAQSEQFQTLADLHLPPALTALCQQVPEATFREEISSTELRRG